jgi:phosphate transport system permease protein
MVARAFGAALALMIMVLALFLLARLVGGKAPGELTRRQRRRLRRAREADQWAAADRAAAERRLSAAPGAADGAAAGRRLSPRPSAAERRLPPRANAAERRLSPRPDAADRASRAAGSTEPG